MVEGLFQVQSAVEVLFSQEHRASHSLEEGGRGRDERLLPIQRLEALLSLAEGLGLGEL